MPLINRPNSSFSAIKPLFEYLRAQKDNLKFLQSLEIGATFILISFFLFFAILPTASAISSLVGDIQSKKLLTTKLKSKINDVIIAQDSFSSVEEKYSLINTGLPDRADFYGAANQIAGAMASIGLQPSRFTFNLTDDKTAGSNLPNNIKSYTLNFPISTDFSKSKELLASLTNSRRSSLIPKASFVLKESSSGNQLELNLTNTYYYWDEKP